MFPTTARLIKHASLPVLLVASALPLYTASYQTAVNLVICLGAIAAVLRSVLRKEYFWAAGFVAIAVVFSPLLMVFKVFLLIGLACSTALASVVAAFLPQPAVALSTAFDAE